MGVIEKRNLADFFFLKKNCILLNATNWLHYHYFLYTDRFEIHVLTTLLNFK